MTQHLDLDALQAAAEAATPGEWTAEEWTVGSFGAEVFTKPTCNRVGKDMAIRDATFIAAANPSVILALIDRLRKAEAASKWISVEKRLPEPGTTVLAFWMPSHGKVHGGCFATATYASPVHWHNPEDDEDDFAKPNFWMLIAAPTSADSEGEKG